MTHDWHMFDTVEVKNPRLDEPWTEPFIGCVVDWSDNFVTVQDDYGNCFVVDTERVTFLRREMKVDKV